MNAAHTAHGNNTRVPCRASQYVAQVPSKPPPITTASTSVCAGNSLSAALASFFVVLCQYEVVLIVMP